MHTCQEGHGSTPPQVRPVGVAELVRDPLEPGRVAVAQVQRRQPGDVQAVVQQEEECIHQPGAWGVWGSAEQAQP